jgi:beta-lactamase regulating signal transducer with metallopeptidase domain
MIAAVLDHLWQSTLFALAAGFLALAFRRAGAGVRYGLWFAASAKFLVPFAVLAALGRLLAPVGPPPATAAAETAIITQVAQPFSQPHAAPVHIAPAFDPALLLLAVWALGCAVVLGFWAVRWARVRTILRSAKTLLWPAPMPVLASPSLMEPGLVGLWRPVLLIPESLPEHLGQAEIDALLAHETSHFRRRDNLTAAAHMLVEALFWFHPLVWWIGARLIEERERACDEAVVGAGHDRTAYARSLVESCRLYLQSPLSCVSGASGSSLETRVAAIMTAPPSSPLSARGRTLLLAAGACALASPVAAGWLASSGGRQTVTHVSAIVSQLVPTGPGASAPTEDTAPSAQRAVSETRPGRAAQLSLFHHAVVLDSGAAPPPGLILARPDKQEVTMKPLLLAAALPLIASAAPAGAQTSADSPAHADAAQSAPSDARGADSSRVICRHDWTFNANAHFTDRTCHTRAEWAAFDQRQREIERQAYAGFQPGSAGLPEGAVYYGAQPSPIGPTGP